MIVRILPTQVVDIWAYEKHPLNGCDFIYFASRLLDWPVEGDDGLVRELISYNFQVLGIELLGSFG